MSMHITVCPLLVPWPRILADLEAAGWPRSKVAASLLTARSTVQRWHEGHEPTFPFGQALLVLHSEVVGRECTQQRLREAGYRAITDRVQSRAGDTDARDAAGSPRASATNP